MSFFIAPMAGCELFLSQNSAAIVGLQPQIFTTLAVRI
jgi:hypothetical protein